MSVVTVADLQNYTGKQYENITMPKMYLDTATDIVCNYLGYDLTAKLNIEYYNGTGTNKIQLKAKPVSLIYSIMDIETNNYLFLADKTKQEQDYYITEEFVEFKNITLPQTKLEINYFSGYGYIDPRVDVIGRGDSTTTSWTSVIKCGDYDDIIFGGYSDTFTNDFSIINIGLPTIFTQTILRIAALLQTESGGDIGVTSKSFGDSGTRSFINFTNFSKYLEPVSKYRLITI
jgi:hypothetical protein